MSKKSKQKINFIFLTLIISLYYLLSAHSENGFWSFPLDDPWIHLTFAKNLSEYGSFSYYKNEIVTSGSTSPIYTFFLAALFFISSNEFVISYVLGISFLVLTIYFVFRLFLLHFNS